MREVLSPILRWRLVQQLSDGIFGMVQDFSGVKLLPVRAASSEAVSKPRIHKA